LRKEFAQYWRWSLLTYPDFTLCQRSAVRRLHVARNFVIALSRGLAHEFPIPHELVPINTARAALSALVTFSFGIKLTLATLIDHHSPSFIFGGLPPFLPFARAISRIRSIPNLFKRA
jgi:hypothetical protein